VRAGQAKGSARARLDEQGQIIIFAIIAINAIFFLVYALLFQGENGLRDTTQLNSVLKAQYTGDAAVTEAMAALAYSGNKPLLPQGLTGPATTLCLSSPGNSNYPTAPNSTTPLNGVYVYAACTYEVPPSYDPDIRNVIITACPGASATPPTLPQPPAQPCSNPVSRVYVTLSHVLSVDSNPITVTVGDWSTLYGINS